jgi:hypothetical protein
MNRKVFKQFTTLQKDFTQLLEHLDKIPNDILEKSPFEGKWSVTQLMYHLNSAESNSIKYVLKKRLAAPQLKRTGINASLRLLGARLAFYLPLKFNAPQLLGAMPAHVAYPEMKQAWTETRKQLLALLESLTDDEAAKPIFRQPTFGRWNIYQMLGFMQTHFNRHRKQMMRAVEVLKTAE